MSAFQVKYPNGTWGTRTQCPRCFGRGYCPEKRKPSRRNPNALGFYARPCPRCGGTGSIEHVQKDSRASAAGRTEIMSTSKKTSKLQSRLRASASIPPLPKLVAHTLDTGAMSTEQSLLMRAADPREIKPGETVYDGDGEAGTLDCVTRANEIGRDGKVVVDGREYYARVWGLRVEEVRPC